MADQSPETVLHGEQWECGPHSNAWNGHDARCRKVRDEAPATVGTPFHHEDERECYARADGSGWWPYRFEDGALNASGGTVCYRPHPSSPPGQVRQ